VIILLLLLLLSFYLLLIIIIIIIVCVPQDLGDALRATEDASEWLIGVNGRSNSHVVLHDRLMTDALMGNAPIKAEHSYCTTHGSRESLDAIGESRSLSVIVAGRLKRLSAAGSVIRAIRHNIGNDTIRVRAKTVSHSSPHSATDSTER